MHQLKRFFIILILTSVLFFQSAEAISKSYIQCDCLSDNCSCFIQKGDEGGAVERIIDKLIEGKYLPRDTPHDIFSEDIEAAVINFQNDNGLEKTGMLDDDTLTLLLWGVLPEKLDILHPETLSQCNTVYIPVHGGKKRHLSEKCSKMENPKKVSDRNAEKLGFDPCKKCYGKPVR